MVCIQLDLCLWLLRFRRIDRVVPLLLTKVWMIWSLPACASRRMWALAWSPWSYRASGHPVTHKDENPIGPQPIRHLRAFHPPPPYPLLPALGSGPLGPVINLCDWPVRPQSFNGFQVFQLLVGGHSSACPVLTSSDQFWTVWDSAGQFWTVLTSYAWF